MTRGTVLRQLHQWFVAIFGVVYITGYLIDTFYYSSLGINDAGAEVIKLRYVQERLTFFILFFIVAIPTYFLLLGGKRMNPIGDNPGDLPYITAANFVAALLFFYTIYYVVVFTPPGYFYFLAHPARLLGLFFLIISVVVGYGLLTAYLWSRRQKSPQKYYA